MIQELTKKEILPVKTIDLIRYGWGNSDLKTWFLTKNRKEIVPKFSKLLFIIYGVKSDKPVHIKDTLPTVGDICIDTNGLAIEITKIEWK